MTPSKDELTQMFKQWAAGESAALDQLMPLLYEELHKIAKRHMAGQSPNRTLQTTAVVNEAYLKLAGGVPHEWESRAHFFGVAAKAMRQVLVDHARARGAAKRGGGVQILPLEEGIAASVAIAPEFVALDEALSALSRIDPRKGQVVELRYFAGLSVEDTARTLQVSAETVARDWRLAKSFLRREMEHREKTAGNSPRP
jgi:RNA polymerase sigma-70 factor (ECF subfamily)